MLEQLATVKFPQDRDVESIREVVFMQGILEGFERVKAYFDAPLTPVPDSVLEGQSHIPTQSPFKGVTGAIDTQPRF